VLTPATPSVQIQGYALFATSDSTQDPEWGSPYDPEELTPLAIAAVEDSQPFNSSGINTTSPRREYWSAEIPSASGWFFWVRPVIGDSIDSGEYGTRSAVLAVP